jgi:hypothetical protein
MVRNLNLEGERTIHLNLNTCNVYVYNAMVTGSLSCG